MKILHIITSLRIGGAEFALFNLLRAMRANPKVKHLVLCFYDGPVVALIRDLNVEVIVIRGFIKGYDPLGLWRVYWIAKSFCPQVIHTSLWAANIVGRLISLLLSVPVINELHGNVVHEGRLRNYLDRISLGKVNYIVAVSPSVQTTYVNHIIPALSFVKRKIIEARLLTIPNGIDRLDLIFRMQKNFLTRLDLGLAPEDFVIGTIGRFEKIKSYDVLIKSVHVMRKNLSLLDQNRIKLCLVGDGSQRNFLEDLVRQYGLESNVIFTGYRLDASRFYSLFDCFALSSQSEGLSIALLEAMAIGLPVISTNISCEHDAIVHEKNGYLIPVNDVGAYAQGLMLLYNKTIKKSGSFEPLSEFPFLINKTVKAYNQLYHRLTGISVD